ncbi:MAG: hypothetical protein WCJ37_14225 [Syntrophus sp. (in: bacteria)]
MRTVKFKPWIGPEYEKTGIESLRILVLGESHYGDKGEEYENFTSEVVEEWAISKRLAFFTKIAKSVLRLSKEDYLSDEHRAQFWNSVSFYNYIQEFVGDGPRQRPSYDLWEKSRQAFIETINQMQPQVCLVFGYELWENLPSPDNEINSDGYQTYVYDTGVGNKMFAGCVAHPSGGLTYSEAHPRITALINMAKLANQPTRMIAETFDSR